MTQTTKKRKRVLGTLKCVHGKLMSEVCAQCENCEDVGKQQTTPSLTEMRIFVMNKMPITGHLINDEGIPEFYHGLKYNKDNAIKVCPNHGEFLGNFCGCGYEG